MPANEQTRREIMKAFVPQSPLPQHLGIRLERLELDEAELSMDYDERLTTLADVVHGGAIAALIDTAGMAVTWSDDVVPDAIGGATISLTVEYVAAARGERLTAHARTVSPHLRVVLLRRRGDGAGRSARRPRLGDSGVSAVASAVPRPGCARAVAGV